MTRKEIERWEGMRSRGKMMYIIRYGMLRWGIGMAVTLSVAFASIDSVIDGVPFDLEGMMRHLVISLLFFPIAGYAWAHWLWGYMEKRYARVRRAPGSGTG